MNLARFARSTKSLLHPSSSYSAVNLTLLPRMAARHIDPQYYRMHAAIDNVDVGHGAFAKEAIKLYLHARHEEGGDSVVQEHWRRIWRGYVTWSTLGNGADEVVERMIVLDRKQMHLGSSLLRHSDILPPFAASLRNGKDPLSIHLRRELGPVTQVLLEAWDPSRPPGPDLLEPLCKDLNACLRSGIYDPQRFDGVELSAETRKLLK